MSNAAKLKKRAAELEQRKQYDKALALYIQALEEGDGLDDDIDGALYNRVGDLAMRLGNVADALSYYERAIDLYAERGFLNNAIALCNKILRQSPGRTIIYHKLGTISAKKGFKSDARRNFLEYADRMQRAGQIDEAFRALKEFADLCPDQDDVRLMLAEQLSKENRREEALEQLQTLYTKFESEGRSTEARATADRMKAIDPSAEPQISGGHATQVAADLIFLDVSYDAPPPRSTPAPLQAPDLDSVLPPLPAEIARASSDVAEDSSGLPWLVPTSAVDALDAADATPASAAPEALDLTDAFGEMRSVAGDPPARDEPPELIDGLEPSSGFVADDAPTPISLLDEPGLLDVESVPAIEPIELDPGLPMVDLPAGSLDTPAALDVTFLPPLDALAFDDVAQVDLEPLSSPSPIDFTGDPPSDVDALDVIDVELTADAGGDSFTGDLEAADAPSASEEGIVADVVLEDARGADDSVAILRDRLHEDPENWALHQQRAEALLEAGLRDDGIRELEAAMLGFESRGDLDAAHAIVDELVRVDPEGVRHYQKRVEYAVRANDRAHLASAYLELADALVRSGDAAKSRFVYQRVIELEPENVAARRALEPDAAAAEPVPEPVPEPEPSPPAQPSVDVELSDIPSATDAAPLPVRPGSDDDFVDLGDWLREDEQPKSTRMVTAAQAPSGDEDADFAEMLQRFKRGVADNVDEEDSESHYDLGIAFKEMGLVDEAIAEFQKALRGRAQDVRIYEALGQCFVEKAQFQIAATILSRALALGGVDDNQLVGVLYLLGLASEAQERWSEALGHYRRVFAVDIEFRDIQDRLVAMEQRAQ